MGAAGPGIVRRLGLAEPGTVSLLSRTAGLAAVLPDRVLVEEVYLADQEALRRSGQARVHRRYARRLDVCGRVPLLAGVRSRGRLVWLAQAVVERDSIRRRAALFHLERLLRPVD